MKKTMIILTVFLSVVFADDKVYDYRETINHDAVSIGSVSGEGVTIFGKKNISVTYFTQRVNVDSLRAWYIVTKIDKDTVYQMDSVDVPTTARQMVVVDRTISWPTLEHLDTTYNK